MITSKSPTNLPTNNQTNLPTISTRLNATNYFFWQKQIETFLAQKGLIQHIYFTDFDSYNKKSKVLSSQEKRYKLKKEKILSKKYESKAKQDEALDNLDDLFHADLSRWSENEAKETKKWNDEEIQLAGIFRGTIDEDIGLP